MGSAHITRKKTNQAKAETARRREVRRDKYASAAKIEATGTAFRAANR